MQVVSLDWKWLFIYPSQGVASVNQLVVPAGVPIHFSLTSASVMNAFFIPQLGSMIYTMNGMTTQLNLQADAPGTFRGLSSHYSGDGFSDMHFDVLAVPAERVRRLDRGHAQHGPNPRSWELRCPGQAEHRISLHSPSVRPLPGCFSRSSRRNCRLDLARGPGDLNPSVSPRTED